MKQRSNVRMAWIVFIFLTWCQLPAHAFESVDEQISHYHEIFDTGTYAERYEMLQRLQWSGISDPRLFDRFEALVLESYQESSFNKNERNLVSHSIRALGYSGNEKYRGTLQEVRENARVGKLKGHAKRALSDLDSFVEWLAKIEASDFRAEGKPVEIATYMKMLSIDDTQVQRLAARAIFHEQQNDPELLSMAADRIREQYLQSDLDREEQDTVAWLCKAIGENARAEYTDLLTEVAEDTPHKKIRRYAADYAR